MLTSCNTAWTNDRLAKGEVTASRNMSQQPSPSLHARTAGLSNTSPPLGFPAAETPKTQNHNTIHNKIQIPKHHHNNNNNMPTPPLAKSGLQSTPLWQERAIPTQQTFAGHRERAGTLPSRLGALRIDVSDKPQHMGSSALLSPGSEPVYDVGAPSLLSTSGARAFPPLHISEAPLVNPESLSSKTAPNGHNPPHHVFIHPAAEPLPMMHETTTPAQRMHESLPIQRAHEPMAAGRQQHSPNVQSPQTGTGPLGPQPPAQVGAIGGPLPSQTLGVNNRSRSGSVNSLGFQPFGASIWTPTPPVQVNAGVHAQRGRSQTFAGGYAQMQAQAFLTPGAPAPQNVTGEPSLWSARGLSPSPSRVPRSPRLAPLTSMHAPAPETPPQPEKPKADTVNISAPLPFQVPPLTSVEMRALLLAYEVPAAVADEAEALAKRASHNNTTQDICPPPELSDRVYVSAVLRDLRKKIDSKTLSKHDIETYALDMMKELEVLASDYMGNTVVQQLFEKVDNDIKDMMLRQLRPYLAQMSVHKNGTWAAQKIIDVASTERQRAAIAESLRAYTPALLLDQYGNYAIQCCLKFGPPWSDFVVEMILAHLCEIAQGRFGARAIRACLESGQLSKSQQWAIAAAITDAVCTLVQNSNGSLLVTWLLDGFTCRTRYMFVVRRMIPHLLALCNSRLASSTVLKVVSNRVDLGAGRLVLDALLDPANDAVRQLLFEEPGSQHGCAFLYKLLTQPQLIDGACVRSVVIGRVRALLTEPGAVLPANKQLLDEVGLGCPTEGDNA